jgi:hypothetical protein
MLQPRVRRVVPFPLSLVRQVPLALAAVAMVAGMSSCKKEASSASSAAPASTPAPAKAANAPAVPEPVQKVFGKWMRSDGGYVLEIRGADLSGVVDAAYFNPKSIKVSRAIWMQGPTGFQIVVELNDVGYPGATYVLSHEPQTDRLVGKYNQPAMQQSFDIEFVRQPKS